MRLSYAEWRGPVPGHSAGGLVRPLWGVVMHIMGSTLAAADAWFHNPSSQVSAHFGIGVDGHVVQWVDTADKAWHAMAANPNYIGIETEGVGGPLTDAQVLSFARVYRDLQLLEGFPFAVAEVPGAHGLNWHGAGGASWGGHLYCPGDDRKAQRGHIIALAQGQPAPTPAPSHEERDMLLILGATGVPALYSSKDLQRKASIPDTAALAELTKGVEGVDYAYMRMDPAQLHDVPLPNGQPGL